MSQTIDWGRTAVNVADCSKCHKKVTQKCVTLKGSNPGKEGPTHSVRKQKAQELSAVGKIPQEAIVYNLYEYEDPWAAEERQDKIIHRAKVQGALVMLRSLLGDQQWLEVITDVVVDNDIDIDKLAPGYFN